VKANYLNNKDILKEIHKSKTTYCTYTQPEYADYDIILTDLKQINKTNNGSAMIKQNNGKASKWLCHC
jgi:hypothetical protein